MKSVLVHIVSYKTESQSNQFISNCLYMHSLNFINVPSNAMFSSVLFKVTMINNVYIVEQSFFILYSDHLLYKNYIMINWNFSYNESTYSTDWRQATYYHLESLILASISLDEVWIDLHSRCSNVTSICMEELTVPSMYR